MSGEAVGVVSDAHPATAGQAAISLARAMKNVSFYEASHPVVRELLQDFLREVNLLLAERPEFAIKFVSGYVVIDDRPVIGRHAPLGNLVGACYRRKVDAIAFQRGVREYDVQRFVALLAMDCRELEECGGMGPLMMREGIQHIVVERLSSREKGDWRWVHACTIDALRSAAAGVRTDRPIDVAGVRLSIREIVDDILGERSILYNLNSMKGMDEYTFIHSLHICILAVELGRQVGLDVVQLEELGVATLLHDVGKIFVPLDILRKPDRLDDKEFAIMSRHPVDGAVALAREPQVPEVAALVAFQHHMHLDHSGYPRLRRPGNLHLYSLVASIADVYDALTTARPYRPPLPPLPAVEVMRGEYAQRLEPRLLARFLGMLGPYPAGTLLGLSEGRMAVVTRPNAAAPENPFVRAMEKDFGRPRLSRDERPLWELADEPGKMAALDPVALDLDLTALLHEAATGVLPDASRTAVLT